MSAAASINTSSRRSTPTAELPRLSIDRRFALLVASCAPFLGLHFYHLWRRPHYQFFPIFLVGWLFLVWNRWPTIDERPTRPVDISRLLLIPAVVTMGIATLILSPFLTAVSCILIVGSILIPIARAYPKQKLGRCWMLLWLIIPPPFSLDIRLIQWLQRGAAKSCSRLLDMLGYPHLLEGTIIEFPGHQLFVEEACSGVQSLFALVVFSLLYAVWQNRTVLQVIPLAIVAAFWATVCNILRLLVIAIAHAEFDVDLATGWKHEALGYALFALAFWMVMSTDRLLCFFLDPIFPKGSNPAVWSVKWNRWIALADNPTGSKSPEQEADASAESEEYDEIVGAPPKAFLVTMCVFGVLQLAMFGQGLVIRYKEFTLSDRLDSITRESLPKEFGPYTFNMFEEQERDRNSEEGQYSKVWSYLGPGYQIFISMDYPFLGAHDLSSCYQHKGWTLGEKWVRDDEQFVWKTMEVDMRGNLGRRGYLLYSLFNEAGDEVEPPAGTRAQVRSQFSRFFDPRLFYVFGAKSGPEAIQSNVYQLQFFVVSDFDLSRTQREEIQQQFAEFQERIQGHWNQEESK